MLYTIMYEVMCCDFCFAIAKLLILPKAKKLLHLNFTNAAKGFSNRKSALLLFTFLLFYSFTFKYLFYPFTFKTLFTLLLFYFYLYLCLKIRTNSMNIKLRGTLCGVGAAVFYGTNPLGAMNLYQDGISANSTLFYRFGLAIVMLGVMMLVQRKKFGVTRSELLLLAILGMFMGSSSASLFISFNYMDVGIASTLLFVYPVMVAVIMALLFKEKVTPTTAISIMLAFGGIALLNQSSDGSSLSTLGVLLVMASSLTYAIYIVVVNKSKLRMSSVKLTFYVLIFGLMTILGYTFAMGETVQLLTTPHQWLYAAQLALMPTVLSLVLMAIAVKDIGSTPTAILGALEPITAVAIGCFCFGESFTTRLAVGIALILTAVLLIIGGKQMSPQRVTVAFTRLGRMIVKTWRWKS